MEQQQLNAQMQDDALRRQEMQQQMEQQQQRQAQEQQPQQQPGAYYPPGSANAGAGPMQQALAATVPYTDNGGNTIRVTPQQKIQLANLDNSGITDPDQLAAMKRQIIGQPNLVKTTLPDGTTTYMPPQQAAIAGYRGQQLDLSQQRVDQGQQRVDLSKGRLQETNDRHTELANEFRSRISAALDARATTTQGKQVAAQLKGQELEARIGSQQAEKNLTNVMATLPPGFDPAANPNDPRSQALQRAQSQVQAAHTNEMAVLQDHFGKLHAAGLVDDDGKPTSTPAAMKPVTPDLAKQYLVKAGGDLVKAKALAAQDGYQ